MLVVQTKPINVKKLIVLLLLTLPLAGMAQEDGIGLRLGEPFSVTFKKFVDDRFAFEGMVGRAGANSSRYYIRSFDNNRPSPNAFYASHAASSALSLNFRASLHEDISDYFDISQGYLLAYAGLGVQLRSVRVDYAYTDPAIIVGSLPPVLRENRTNLDLGPEVFGGAEYYFDDLPISVFGELGMFMELVDRIGHLRLQGAIGIRYLF